MKTMVGFEMKIMAGNIKRRIFAHLQKNRDEQGRMVLLTLVFLLGREPYLKAMSAKEIAIILVSV